VRSVYFKKKAKTDFRPVDKLNKEEARKEVKALMKVIEYRDYLY